VRKVNSLCPCGLFAFLLDSMAPSGDLATTIVSDRLVRLVAPLWETHLDSGSGDPHGPAVRR
jgi:hypothetical protein